MTSVLFSWIGNTDLEAFGEAAKREEAPLIRAVREREFEEIHLARDKPDSETEEYIGWLKSQTTAVVRFDEAPIESPVSYRDIYSFVASKFKQLDDTFAELDLTIHLSPGTPQMAAVSILIGKTRLPSPAQFLQSSPAGVVDVDIPFDISAEFLPTLAKNSAQNLLEQFYAQAPQSPSFDKILGKSPQITDAKNDAIRFSMFGDVPVLILGESGTGKELFAKAICHNCISRDPDIFLARNCGALAGDLINSELFGHKKGAFTGAVKDKMGVFQAANGGTVFLDEFGELPEDSQVRLLRVLQEGKVTPVGSNEEIDVDVRVIAATNRDLIADISNNKFRADLFHRVAVGIVTLPPLRSRSGDIALLTKHFMNNIASQFGFENKSLSAKAMNVVMEHDWPGNVRELENSLKRACVLSPTDRIDESTMRRAIVRMPRPSGDWMPQEIGPDFSLDALVAKVEKKYIEMALRETKHTKTKAAALLGIKSHQNLTRKMVNYGLDG